MRLPIIVASILILGGVPLEANIVVSVLPPVQTAPLGSITAAQVQISGLGLNVPPSLGAYDLNVAFDPAILSFSGLTFGDPLLGDQLNLSGGGTVADFSNPSAGLLEFFEISLDNPAVLDSMQSNRFVLATLQFQTIGSGSSLLSPTINSLGDSLGAPLGADVQTGRIDVVATPEPQLFWAFPLGLAGLAWRLRRLKRSAA